MSKLLIKDSNPPTTLLPKVGTYWKFERLMELWKEGKRDERVIVISALEKISKKDYENSKQFVLNVLKDISDWEICDQLCLKVIVNLAVQNQKETFSLMHEWIKSKN